jgi:hypothetical protein
MVAIAAIAVVALGLAFVLRRNRRPHGVGVFRQGNSTVPPGLLVTEGGDAPGLRDATDRNTEGNGDLGTDWNDTDSTGADSTSSNGGADGGSDGGSDAGGDGGSGE